MNVSCGNLVKEVQCHDKVIDHGVETFQLAKDVDLLFGGTNVDHFISNFGSKALKPVWNSQAHFGGRYTFVLQAEVDIDYQKCKLIAQTAAATAYLNEVTNVSISASGMAGAELRGGNWILGESQWKELIRNKGDWASVQLPILTNAPTVKGFDEYVRQVREAHNRREELGLPNRKR